LLPKEVRTSLEKLRFPTRGISVYAANETHIRYYSFNISVHFI
jgi:hypothetical protein